MILVYELFVNFLCGTLFGIVDAWNRKVSFLIWVGLVIFAVVGFYIGGGIPNPQGLSIVQAILNMVLIMLGILTGQYLFRVWWMK